ncbi:RIO1 family regulatory kinase/ATPase domain-containing protein [Halostella litorea]|uniref:RIO1 family regulatory kinase/ATPase domain-containing protein n=1 Tax=Halostella litorea TaxID=2528831 RepID=UPI001091B6EA|nr:RIO1 family regulatory kinase/ATPase [Halostella litorea]
MEVRDLVRGTVDWEATEAVAREIATRAGRDEVRIEFLDADNWLSTPCVVDEEWFVKIVSKQNAFVHAVFTTGRNLGAVTSGREGFFDHVGSPLEMAQRELAATERMREIGVRAPEPVEAFEVDGLGVLVLEYLEDFRTFDDLDAAAARRLTPDLFDNLRRMHDDGLAHGDLRGENVLVKDDEVYFIDATSVREDGIADARAYDLASALATLEPTLGTRTVVELALEAYSPGDLLAAREFLDFVNVRPDHDFDAERLKGEIERVAEASG